MMCVCLKVTWHSSSKMDQVLCNWYLWLDSACLVEISGFTIWTIFFTPTSICTRIIERQTDIKTIYIIHIYLIIDNMITRQTCIINLIINKLLSHTIFRLRCFVLHWSKNSFISLAIGNQLLPFFWGQSARFTTMYHKSMVSIVDLLRGREGRRLSQPFKTP